MNNELKKYLAGEAMDETCNCGVDHGSAEKNVAPSVVEGDEKASEAAVSAEAQDAAAKYLAMCEDERKMYPYVGKTASGSSGGFANNVPDSGTIPAAKSKAQKSADMLNKLEHGDGLSHGTTPFRVRGGKVVGAKPLLARNGDDGKRRHADGSVCKAASPESCPFNKKAEAGEKAINGEEKAKYDSKPFEVDKDRLHKALSNRGVENRGILGV